MIPCAKSELMIFEEVPVQSSMLSSCWVDIHSINNPEQDGPLEFIIPNSQDEYLDLNDTKLYLRGKVQVTVPDAVVAPVNLLLHSLFQDVTITLNDTVIQGGDQLYSYKAFMNSLLLFDKGTKNTQLSAAGWYPDEPEKFNVADLTGNKGFQSRNALNDGFELIGPLHLDIMTQPRYLIPGVDVKVRLTRQKNSFTLMCSNKNGNVARVVLTSAVLYVRRVKVLSSVLDGHESGLLKYNALYPVQSTRAQTFTIATGSQSINKENLFQGRMPKIVVVGMVGNSAYNGNFKQNPFEFGQHGISYCGLFRDGECIPEREPYAIDKEGQLMRPYMSMIQGLEMFNKNANNGIKYNEFQNGSTLFVFNLCADLTAGSGCQQAYRSGNLRLELRFRTPLAATISVIVYGIFDGKMEITKNKNILLDY